MDSAVTFLFLFVFLAGSCSASFSMVFSSGTRLLVDGGGEETDESDEDDAPLPRRDNTTDPSVEIFCPVWFPLDPGSPPLLVCLLTGLSSPVQEVLWWLDDVVAMSSGGPWTRSGGGYSATSVWEVSAADWRSTSSYWCGTIQDGRAHRQKLCSRD